MGQASERALSDGILSLYDRFPAIPSPPGGRPEVHLQLLALTYLCRLAKLQSNEAQRDVLHPPVGVILVICDGIILCQQAYCQCNL